MIHAIAIDDEPLALSVIENFCNKTEGIELQKTFTGPNEAVRYLDEFPIDLVFLDINMPGLNGIELIKKTTQNTLVIFTTAYSEYAVESYNLNAIDYLLKPFTYDRFRQSVKKAIEYREAIEKNKPSHSIFVRADYSLLKIDLMDILYIEGLDDYLRIYTTRHKPIVTRMTMKSILEKLPDDQFIRIHRSYIIPLQKIESIRNKVVIVGGKSISIGQSYESDFFSRIKV